MPNWCYNSVRFKGEANQMAEIEKMILAMIEKARKENLGQLFPFMQDGLNGYFFDPYLEEDRFSYLTKWVPNTAELIAIAIKLSLDYVHSYNEPGNMIYGRDFFVGGELAEFLLESEDFQRYEYDEESECYLFEGESYEYSDEIKEILLGRLLDSEMPNPEQHFEELKR